MRKNPSSLHPYLWLIAVPLAACATLRQDTALRSKVADYAFQMPIDAVWPGVIGLLKENRFELKEDPESFLLVTDWREDVGFKNARSWSRYLVYGVGLDADRCTVRFLRQSKTERVLEKVDVAPAERDYRKPTPHYTTVQGFRYLEQTGSSGVRPLVEDATRQGAVRDFNMELALIRRLAPQHASALEGQVSARP
jgi:hypothetical protein